MYLTINQAQHELRFGFKFMKTLDELTTDIEKTPGLTPLDNAVLRLGTGDVTITPIIAAAALSHNPTVPAMDDIETAIEDMAAGLKAGSTVCSVFIDALKTAPLHTESVTKMAEVAARMAEMQQQMIKKSMSELESVSQPEE